MTRPVQALGRFGLEFVALLLGYDDPGRAFELRAALSETDDRHAAEQVEALARRHRKAYADHQRLVGPSILALREEYLPPDMGRLLGATALHALNSSPGSFPWAAELRRGPLADALDDAVRASQREDARSVTRALHSDVLRQAAPELAAILRGVVEVYGDDDGELVERLPAYARTTPPLGFDLDRGRKDRADLVLAVLRAHDVQLREPERGRVRILTRDDLAEAILRDPFWDDIDASVQEQGVVAGILDNRRPSPAIDGATFGQKHVYIKRIVR